MKSERCPSCGHLKRSAATSSDGLCDECGGRATYYPPGFDFEGAILDEAERRYHPELLDADESAGDLGTTSSTRERARRERETSSRREGRNT